MTGLDLFYGIFILAVIAAILLVVFFIRAIVKLFQARAEHDEDAYKWYGGIAIALGIIVALLILWILSKLA